MCIHVYLCNVTTVQPLCTASPAATFWQYGLLAPFLAILLLALLGRYSTSLCYTRVRSWLETTFTNMNLNI